MVNPLPGSPVRLSDILLFLFGILIHGLRLAVVPPLSSGLGRLPLEIIGMAASLPPSSLSGDPHQLEHQQHHAHRRKADQKDQHRDPLAQIAVVPVVGATVPIIAIVVFAILGHTRFPPTPVDLPTWPLRGRPLPHASLGEQGQQNRIIIHRKTEKVKRGGGAFPPGFQKTGGVTVL